MQELRVHSQSVAVAVAVMACVVLALGCGRNPAELAESSKKESRPPIALHQAPDQDIHDRLVGILRQIEGLEDVTVGVHEGVVHLGGITGNAALEQQALLIAMRVEGVVHVNDEIKQPRGIVTPVGRTIERIGRGAYELLPRLGSAVIAFLPFLLLAHLLKRWRRPFRMFGGGALSGGILRAALRWCVLWLGLVLALDLLGVFGIIWMVFGALGILGVVAGFVFKDWVADYLPGMALGLHPPFNAGDLIQLGSHEGRVVRITPRATVLMTTDGEEVRLPNSLAFREPMINYSRHRERRLRFTLPLAPRAEFRLVQEVGCRTLLAIHGVMQEPPPFLRTRTLERDLIEVEFFAWVDQDEVNFRTIESTAKRLVFDALEEHGVPMPERTLIVHSPPVPERGGAAKASLLSMAAAENQDRAFLDRQLAKARADRGERDLLENGLPPKLAARGNLGA